MTSRPRRLLAAAASTVLIGLTTAACSSGGDDSSDSDGSSSSRSRSGAAEPAAAADGSKSAPDDSAGGALAGGADSDVAQPASGPDDVEVVADPDPRSLIREGNVALRSTDIGRTLFDIRKVLQQTGGEVSDDDTQADARGEAERALLTVRVPVERYQAALDQLKALGAGKKGVRLITSTSTTQDVSTDVVDTDVRVTLLKRSIQRISLLLDRATSIRDVVSIERELASREADLGSLEKQQKFLADQTSLSTITISVERPARTRTTEPEEKDESGFLAGLDNGWEAFRDVTTGLLTGAGALLPFALLALVVGVPLRVWLRRRQPRPVVGTVGDAG